MIANLKVTPIPLFLLKKAFILQITDEILKNIAMKILTLKIFNISKRKNTPN